MEKHSIGNTEVLFTARQAARFLCVSLSTLKKIIYQGKIKTLKTPGGHHRISKSELVSFVAKNSTSTIAQLCPQTDLFYKDAFTVLEPLVNGLENRMFFHRGHANKVVQIALNIAEALGFEHSRIIKIKLAALLHDIGLLTIKEEIINKRTLLTADEYSAIKTHPSIGYGIINAINHFNEISVIIKQHHERFDGRGYPDGLTKDEICIEAKVLSIAEAFSVMTAENSYKNRLPDTEALEELKRNSHKQFDPQIVKFFLKVSDYE